MWAPPKIWLKQTNFASLRVPPLKVTQCSERYWQHRLVSIWTPTREARALTGVGLIKVWLIRLIIKLALDLVWSNVISIAIYAICKTPFDCLRIESVSCKDFNNFHSFCFSCAAHFFIIEDFLCSSEVWFIPSAKEAWSYQSYTQ